MNLSEDEQQIIALRAELCDMQEAKVKGQNQEKTLDNVQKETEKRRKGKKGKQSEQDKWAWKKITP